MPHSDDHPEEWGESPYVIREIEVRLLHERADTVDAYWCQWPDGTESTSFREGAVRGIDRDRTTFVMRKDADGVHSGRLQMHLVPGQSPADEIRCKAGTYGDQRSLVYDMNAYRAWQADHPGEELNVEILWSDWSNGRAIGEVEPDPVPEPALVLLLALGIIGLCFAAWRQRTQ